jgi:transcriptional regulator with XRE-family HTH domain
MSRSSAKQHFSDSLQKLRLNAGQPSYRDLAEISTISRATINRMMTGSTVPRWGTVAKVLTALGADLANKRVLVMWKTSWKNAFIQHSGLTVDAEPPGPDAAADEPDDEDGNVIYLEQPAN